jgi:hypothetical protein
MFALTVTLFTLILILTLPHPSSFAAYAFVCIYYPRIVFVTHRMISSQLSHFFDAFDCFVHPFCVLQSPHTVSVYEQGKKKVAPLVFRSASRPNVTGDVDRRRMYNISFVFHRWTMPTDALLPQT